MIFCPQSVHCPETPQTRRNPMENFLFIGGHQDGLNIPLTDDVESIQLADGATGRETYRRDPLAVGAFSSFTFNRREKLTPEEFTPLFAKHSKAWCVNLPGFPGYPDT